MSESEHEPDLDEDFKPEPGAELVVLGDAARSEIEDGWEQLLKILDKVPFVGGLKRDVAQLSRLVTHRRLGRFAAVGSLGSGRSQFAGALLGGRALRSSVRAVDWAHLDVESRRAHWIEIDAVPGASARARDAFAIAPPDVLLLVVTPEEVEAGLGAVLEPFMGVLGVAQAQAEAAELPAPLVYAVLNKADTLPPETAAAPFPEEKRQRIELVLQRFRRQLKEAALPIGPPVAVVSPSAEDHALGIDAWGIEALREEIALGMPEPAQVETARALQAHGARRKLASTLIQASSTLAITVALMPVPLSDIVLIAPIQGILVTTIAYLSGRGWDGKTAAEWMTSVGVVGGVGFGFRTLARQVVKLVPGAGSVVAGSIAGAGTLALGRSAMGYFLPE